MPDSKLTSAANIAQVLSIPLMILIWAFPLSDSSAVGPVNTHWWSFMFAGNVPWLAILAVVIAAALNIAAVLVTRRRLSYASSVPLDDSQGDESERKLQERVRFLTNGLDTVQEQLKLVSNQKQEAEARAKGAETNLAASNAEIEKITQRLTEPRRPPKTGHAWPPQNRPYEGRVKTDR